MTEPKPVACSLDTSELQHRLAAIATIGAESLIDRETDGTRHLLRFHSNAATRRRLEEIVAAEAQCCSFLDLELEQRNGDLVLSVTAPEEGRPVADALAAAFAGVDMS